MESILPNHQPRYSTRYQVVASHPDHPPVTVGYTSRVSRQGLLAILRKRADAIISHCGIGPDDSMSFHCKPRVHAKVSGWTIGFTGRTELDVQVSGF